MSDIRFTSIPRSLTVWEHFSGLPLADPAFGQTGKIDILLGVDVFVVLHHGWRNGHLVHS